MLWKTAFGDVPVWCLDNLAALFPCGGVSGQLVCAALNSNLVHVEEVGTQQNHLVVRFIMLPSSRFFLGRLCLKPNEGTTLIYSVSVRRNVPKTPRVFCAFKASFSIYRFCAIKEYCRSLHSARFYTVVAATSICHNDFCEWLSFQVPITSGVRQISQQSIVHFCQLGTITSISYHS